ncbi:TIGR03089 family protein [Marmoricola sp. URHB0036]|uniref:TIGR03089 family protein n=1 Tax=Marmoricola sp. URHB0036 TaxID=1298863 RepID=UPI0003FA93D7|nr:TIGR03089 family protein [Marmoricola sp. URHB0036]
MSSPANPPRTFPELLAARLSGDPGQPLLTAYDDTTGERTELSVTTYANWVSKTANLLTDELGLDAGDTVLLDLPSHWLVPVFLGAAWSSALSVATDTDVLHDLVVCGPDSVERHQHADTVVACALLPFAVRFAEPLPEGVLDYGVLWPGQSDVFVPLTPPTPDTPAWLAAGDARTQAELLEEATGAGYAPGARLLTDVHPAADHGVPAFLGPLLSGGSLVLLRDPRELTWPARLEDERADVQLRA